MNFEINSSNMNLKSLVTLNARCRAVFLFFLFFHYVFLYIDTYSRAFKRIGLELCTVNSYRGITAGATAVAPKFSDALTLFQPRGEDSAQHRRGRTKNFPVVTSLGLLYLEHQSRLCENINEEIHQQMFRCKIG